jgi:threonine dehydratase
MVGLEEIMQARQRIRESIYLSPCSRSVHFSERLDCTTFFKMENLQRTGSFKERGALNKILQLTDEEKRRGIVTASAGNHAQAVAFHAGTRGIKAVICMPKLTPLIKVSNTRNYGGEVRLVGDNFDEAFAHAKELEAEHGYTFLHPFDDPAVIAGQGTIALELMEQNDKLDIIVVPVGGGGVISGIAAAYKSLKPEVRIVGVEASVLPSMKASREKGRRLSLPPASTLADGIAVKRPGEITLKMVTRHVDELVTVGEEEIANAILLILEREKTVAEGAAAATLAALYNGHIKDTAGKNVCLVLCGGNIDVNVLSRVIERGLAKDGRMWQVVVRIQDRPGALAMLLDLVARQGANVIEVHHQRTFADAALGDVVVGLTLETRGLDHIATIETSLRGAGVEIRKG